MAGANSVRAFVVERADEQPTDNAPDTDYRAVTPGYFSTIGIDVRQGRDFTEADRTGAEVVIVSASLARQHFAGVDPIGMRVRLGDVASGPWRTIVGVVADARYQSLETPRVRPMMYLPHRGLAAMTLVLRASVAPGSLAPAIRREIRALDPALAAGTISAADDIVKGELTQRRFQVVLFGTFALIALVLAAVGIYGTMSYAVAQRTRELGVRMAMGARSGQLVGLIVRQGIGLAALGILSGVGGALAATRVLQSLLFETSPRDPVVYAAIGAVVLPVAGMASWVPARRATRIGPLAALQDPS
jgi:predicted permease